MHMNEGNSLLKWQIEAILESIRPGEKVTSAMIAKRCGISIARAAHYLSNMSDGGLIAWSRDPDAQSRYLYSLPEPKGEVVA